MYLSSRFAACVGIAVFFVAGAVPLAARPALTGMRPTLVTPGPRVPYSGIAPTLVAPGHPNYAGYRGIRPTLVSAVRRGLRYGYGGGGLGYDGYGIGDFGDAGYPQPGLGPIDAPPPFAYPPLPPRCPQIIEIGGGLAHKPATRVVYGAPCLH